jgi:hypothetical protein
LDGVIDDARMHCLFVCLSVWLVMVMVVGVVGEENIQD